MSAKSDKVWELCLKGFCKYKIFLNFLFPTFLPFPSFYSSLLAPFSSSNSLLLSVLPLSFSFLPFPPLLVCTATSQIIRFSGNASVSVYEQALSSVFYMNAAAAPSRTPLRRVTYEVTDGIFTSNTLTGLVNMTNRSPVVLLNATNQVSAFRFMSQTPPYIWEATINKCLPVYLY